MKNQFLSAKEVAEICGCSLSKSYAVIRALNAELEALPGNYLTMSGKVSRKYLMEKIYGMDEAME